jgi:hypothetical protein
MLRFEEAKRILNKYGHEYTDEEIKIIREFIAIVLDIDYKLFQRRLEESKIDQLNINDSEAECHFIRPGEYRRAS